MAARPTFTRIAAGFIRLSSRAPIRPRVALVSGRAMTSTSAAVSTWSRSESVPMNSTGSLVRPEELTAWMRAPKARISRAVAPADAAEAQDRAHGAVQGEHAFPHLEFAPGQIGVALRQ